MLQALHAGWVVPAEPAGVALADHTLVIEDARITAIMPTAEWRAPGAMSPSSLSRVAWPTHSTPPSAWRKRESKRK